MINGETVKYVVPYLSQDLMYEKFHPLRDAALGADCSTLFRILKIITVGLKMDSGKAIKNCYML